MKEGCKLTMTYVILFFLPFGRQLSSYVWYFLEDWKQFRRLRKSQLTLLKNQKVVRFLKICIQNDVKEQIFVIFSVKHIGFCNSSIEVLILPRTSQTNFFLRKLLNCSIFHCFCKQIGAISEYPPLIYILRSSRQKTINFLRWLISGEDILKLYSSDQGRSQ